MTDYVNKGGQWYGDENCALCTVAAILGIDTHRVTQMLNSPDAGQTNDALARGYMARHNIPYDPDMEDSELLPHSLAGIRDFIIQAMAYAGRPVLGFQGGSWDAMVPMDTQIRFMNSTPEGTKFAVWASDSAVIAGMNAHWNYAEKMVSGIEFRDYQYNDAPDQPPEIASHFIPPRQQRRVRRRWQQAAGQQEGRRAPNHSLQFTHTIVVGFKRSASAG